MDCSPKDKKVLLRRTTEFVLNVLPIAIKFPQKQNELPKKLNSHTFFGQKQLDFVWEINFAGKLILGWGNLVAMGNNIFLKFL